MHSYADDTQLYVDTPANRIAEQSNKLTICITDIESWMCSNRLILNTEKTQFTVLGTRYQLAKITTTSVKLKANQIDISEEVIRLGVVLDQELMTFAAHVRRLSSRCFSQLRQLRTIRHSLNEAEQRQRTLFTHLSSLGWTIVTVSSPGSQRLE